MALPCGESGTDEAGLAGAAARGRFGPPTLRFGRALGYWRSVAVATLVDQRCMRCLTEPAGPDR